MGDYTSLFAGSVMINDEGTYPGKMQVMVESDSLGKVTIKFGNSMTLRLDSESAGKLAELIIEAEILAGQLQSHAEQNRNKVEA